MHALTLSILLLPAALAHRHRYGPGHSHIIHHRPLPIHGTVVSSGTPSPSAVSNAPYGMGNTTSFFGTTGLVTAVSTASATAPESSDLGGLGDSSFAPTSSAVAVGHAGSPGGSSVGALASTPCDSGVVTVTENPIVTVTITSGQGGSTSEEVPESSVVQPASTSEVEPSIVLPVSSHSSVYSVITGVPASSATSSLSVAPVSEASTPETTSVPTSTPVPTPTSAIEALSTSPSETPASSPSTVTVIPIPASTPATSQVEAVTPSSSSKATTKQQTPATVVSSSVIPESTTGGSTSGAGGCPGKRGIIATAGGPNQDQANISLAFSDQPNICWMSNWYFGAPPYWNPEKEYVPQLYGKSSDLVQWQKSAQDDINAGHKIFLSFGEPEAGKPGDRDYQTPDEAVSMYVAQMNPWAKQGVKLCSPAVLQPPEHIQWLETFLQKCEAAGCIIDMICIHWYDTTSVATPGFPEFQRTVEKAISLANGKKVWVDNFQANGIPADVKTFLDEAIPYLEGNEHVERYAYVPPLRTDPNKYGPGYRTDQFIDPDLSSNGTLTDLGKYYSNFKVGA